MEPTSGVWRTMGTEDGVTTVTLHVNMPEGARYFIIDEVLPPGAEVVDAGTGDNQEAGHLKWIALDGMGDTVGDQTFTYTVRLQDGTDNQFTGTYFLDGMQDVRPISWPEV